MGDPTVCVENDRTHLFAWEMEHGIVHYIAPLLAPTNFTRLEVILSLSLSPSLSLSLSFLFSLTLIPPSLPFLPNPSLSLSLSPLSLSLRFVHKYTHRDRLGGGVTPGGMSSICVLRRRKAFPLLGAVLRNVRIPAIKDTHAARNFQIGRNVAVGCDVTINGFVP